MTVHRVRASASGVDRYGDPIPGTSTSTEIANAFVGPSSSTDITGVGRDGVTIDAVLYAPWGTDITTHDLIVVTNDGANNGTYRVDGQPAEWTYHMGDGSRAGQATPLTRAEG